MKRGIIIIAVAAVIGFWLFFQNGEEVATGRPAFGGPVTVVAEVVRPAPLASAVEALGTASANESVPLTSSIT